MSELITINGVQYNITNWDEFTRKYLFAFGQMILNEIQDEALRMKLFDSGNFIARLDVRAKGDDTLLFTSAHEFSQYLEFGTYALGRSFGDSFPTPPLPKKKDISRKAASLMAKGMQPFAPFRRVLYNEEKLKQLSKKALAVAA